MLSAILSSFNEVNNDLFWANLKLLRAHPDVEIIVVDGGSTDGTLQRLQGSGLRLEIRENSPRAVRYNAGIDIARGEIILLVHPRSLLPRPGLDYLREYGGARGWGAFRHAFDQSHPVLSFTSWYSNTVRGRGRSIYYLDHCLYFTADLKGLARFPEVALFEDTLFCLKLRRHIKPKLLPFSVRTSALRFRKNGILRQGVLNQILKILFYLRVSDKTLSRIYERGIKLN